MVDYERVGLDITLVRDGLQHLGGAVKSLRRALEGVVERGSSSVIYFSSLPEFVEAREHHLDADVAVRDIGRIVIVVVAVEGGLG